jgi:hypothetical protein
MAQTLFANRELLQPDAEMEKTPGNLIRKFPVPCESRLLTHLQRVYKQLTLQIVEQQRVARDDSGGKTEKGDRFTVPLS